MSDAAIARNPRHRFHHLYDLDEFPMTPLCESLTASPLIRRGTSQMRSTKDGGKRASKAALSPLYQKRTSNEPPPDRTLQACAQVRL